MMNALNYLTMSLERQVALRNEALADLTDKITKYGIGDRLGWLSGPLRDDAYGLVAAQILKRLDSENLPTITEALKDRLVKETSFIVPSNVDAAFKVYTVQAYQHFAGLCEEVMKMAQEEAIEEQLSPDGTSAFDPH
jgi:hypothetical protein